MSVFKEKNGIFEGVNRMCGPAGAHCAPAGFATAKKTRLEKHFDRLAVKKKKIFTFEKLVRTIIPCEFLRKGGGNKKNY